MAHDVFISYATEDKNIADAICAILESRNIRCWIAPRDVRPGVIYSEALIDALDSSRLLVLVFSANSNKSPHVMREMERVVSKGIPILPFRIENIEPSKSIEYFIGNTHWLDALTPPLKKHLNYLADNVEMLLQEKMDSADKVSNVFTETPAASRLLSKSTMFQWLKGLARKRPAITAGITVVTLLLFVAGAYAINLRMAAEQKATQDFEAVKKSSNLAQQAFELHMSTGDPQEILALCNQAIELNHNNDLAYYVRGANYYFHMGQSSQGFKDVQKAIELSPSFRGSYYFVRGQMYLDTGSKDLAISDFEKAIELATKYNHQDIIDKAAAKLRQLGVPGY